MKLIADTHVHFYGLYDIDEAFSHLSVNLGNLSSSSVRVATLCERSDCCFFKDLKEGRIELDTEKTSVNENDSGDALFVQSGESGGVWIYPGRQLVSKEGLEVLALLIEDKSMEGLPAADIVRSVRDNGGVPVISWAAGKWMFGRGAVVRRMVEGAESHDFLIGDTSLRPYGCPQPMAMKMAGHIGIGIIAGSDPLPFAGEETFMGSYGTLIDVDAAFQPGNPDELREVLFEADNLGRVGMRNDFVTAAIRVGKCKFCSGAGPGLAGG